MKHERAQPAPWSGTATRVLASRRISPTAHWIAVERPRGFAYEAGQHATLELATREGVQDHLFSIAASPTRDTLEFATRLTGSAFKDAFAALEEGSGVAVSNPEGSFVLDVARPAVFVSGGIGITPIKAMLEWATDTGLEQDLVLLFGNRNEQEILFRDELEALADANPRLRAEHTLDDASPAWHGARGHIDADFLRRHAGDLPAPVHYVCGPPGMVRGLAGVIRGMDARARVKTENFSGYK